MDSTLLLTVTALVEVPTGLALLTLPAVPFALLFGVRQPAPEALMVGRVAGAALIAIGVASWLARRDARSRAQLGLVGGILFYNLAVAAILVLSATVTSLSGVALWPGVLLHSALGVWCVAVLRDGGQH